MRELFLGSLDHGILAGQHFAYQWPVQYNPTALSVITEIAPADGRGQIDVGEVYAWVHFESDDCIDDHVPASGRLPLTWQS